MATRVFKYGLIPIGHPPQEAVAELLRADSLCGAVGTTVLPMIDKILFTRINRMGYQFLCGYL